MSLQLYLNGRCKYISFSFFFFYNLTSECMYLDQCFYVVYFSFSALGMFLFCGLSCVLCCCVVYMCMCCVFFFAVRVCVSEYVLCLWSLRHSMYVVRVFVLCGAQACDIFMYCVCAFVWYECGVCLYICLLGEQWQYIEMRIMILVIVSIAVIVIMITRARIILIHMI